MVLAWSILPPLAAAGMEGPARPVQATHRIASRTTQVTLMTFTLSAVTQPVDRQPGEHTLVGATYTVRPGDTLSGIATALAVPGGWQAVYAANRQAIGSDPGIIRPGTVLGLAGLAWPARYRVAPGDTLSGIAIALGIPGGWRALYAANRQAIGSDPGIIHPGTVLTAVRATTRAPATVRARPAPERPSPDRTTPSAIHAGPAPPPAQPIAHPTIGAGSMPRWLKAMLLAVGIVTGLALLTESALAVGRRLRDRRRRLAVRKASIIKADHERLIVTYSRHDDTIYLLTPPDEDPRTVLRAARLVLPEEKYLELADELGMPDNGPAERP